MNAKANSVPSLSAKLIAVLVAVALVLLGVIGLVLPFIPGLLLLLIAAVLVARHFPSIDGWLRQNRAFGRHMEWADTFYELPLLEKMRLGVWVCLKIVLDSLALVGGAITKMLKAVTSPAEREAEH
jgi:uncharacterized membrane protein YbaN (DUF454 family)